MVAEVANVALQSLKNKENKKKFDTIYHIGSFN